MLAWTITAYFAVATFIGITVFLIIRKYGKNKYFHSYVEDDFIREKVEGGAKNSVYSTKFDTKKYIEKYILRKSVYERSVIVNYNEKFDSISYYIKCFNKAGKVIQLVEVTDINTETISKVVVVDKSTDKINIIIKNVNNLPINQNELMPIPKKNILLYSLLLATDLFALLYVLRHFIAMIILGAQFRPFLMHYYNWILLGASLVISLLVFLITFLSMRRRSWRNRNGGAVAYEFF